MVQNLSFILVLIYSFTLISCTKEQDFNRIVDPDKVTASSGSGPVVCGFGGGAGGTNDPTKGIISDLLYMDPVSSVYNLNSGNVLSYFLFTQGNNPTKRQQACGELPPITDGRILFTTDFIESAHYGPLGCSLPTGSFVDVVNGTSQLFLKDISVPMMNFNTGFPIINSSGQTDLLRTQSGNPLIEYFSLKLRGKLSLKDLPLASYPDGNYYFQLYSDDGSVLSFKQGGNYTTAIDFDGHHSPTSKDSINSFTLSHADYLEFKINYFQGPQTQIALTLKWKKPGSSTFETVPADAFFLPDGITNPCH